MSMDAVHFKTMLDKSRTTSQEQEEELRRRQAIIADLELKVKKIKFRRRRMCRERTENERFFPTHVLIAGVGDGC